MGRGGALNPPEAIGSLRTALAFDTRLRVVVAHGLFDLVTPYSATRVILDQLPATAVATGSVPHLSGWALSYALDGSRVALREEARCCWKADDAAHDVPPSSAPSKKSLR